MQPLLYDFLTSVLAATTPPIHEKAPTSEPQASGSWQVWLILVAVSVLTGLAVKLVSDPPRHD
jgi:hypothetical protein